VKLGDDVDIGALCSDLHKDRLVLRKPRQERYDMVREYVGRHYSEEGSARDVPCNLLAAYIGIVGRKLIANNPRFSLSTWNQSQKPAIHAMEDWINTAVVKIKLAATIKRIVIDSLFSIGIAKVALATPADGAVSNWTLGPGQPSVWRVDLDDFVFDTRARDFAECKYIGHRYRAPLRVIRESKIYSKDRKNLSASENKIYNMEGDERINLIGMTTLAGQEEFDPGVDLWEIYLPRHQLVLTLRDDNLTGASQSDHGSRDINFGKALRIQRWLGPRGGPYHILGLGTVPGNVMPKSPIQDLYDLHLAINRMVRKLLRQADRQKEVVFAAGTASEDGQRLIRTSDGEATIVDNPDKLKPVMWGAPNAQNFQLFTAMKDLFNWLGGNLEIMGGLAPQSKTAAQDKLMNENSSATISEMQDATANFTASMGNALCWFFHHHPTKVMRSEFSLPGLGGISAQRRVYPAGYVDPSGAQVMTRSTPFEDLDISVDPYSLQYQTPQQRMQAIMAIITGMYMPMAQLAQQSGIQLDLNALFDLAAKYQNQPDMHTLLTIQAPPTPDTQLGGAQGAPGSGGEPGVQPVEQEPREYIRRSLGGDTPQARQDQVMKNMVGAGARAGHNNGDGTQ
jgi:hypothetical protein